MSSSVPEGTFVEALNPLSWLIGKWRAKKADVFYPTMEALSYNEELEFLPTGKPVLQYRAQTWLPDKNALMHLESGYLRLLPENDTVSLLVAHNFGITEISEGFVKNNELFLESKDVCRSSFAGFSKVTQIQRHLCLKGELLETRTRMATDAQPLQDHILAVYEKISP